MVTLSKEAFNPDGSLYGDPQFDSKLVEQRNVKRAQATIIDKHKRVCHNLLNESEITRLLMAAKTSRHGIRDYCMFLLMYRHGLRVSELIGARLVDIDLVAGCMSVKRMRKGLSTMQLLQGGELRALRAYLRTRKDHLPWLFLSSQGGQMTRQNVNYLIKKAGERASLGHVYPAMLRKSCKYVLSSNGTEAQVLQAWLGYRDARRST